MERRLAMNEARIRRIVETAVSRATEETSDYASFTSNREMLSPGTARQPADDQTRANAMTSTPR